MTIRIAGWLGLAAMAAASPAWAQTGSTPMGLPPPATAGGTRVTTQIGAPAGTPPAAPRPAGAVQPAASAEAPGASFGASASNAVRQPVPLTFGEETTAPPPPPRPAGSAAAGRGGPAGAPLVFDQGQAGQGAGQVGGQGNTAGQASQVVDLGPADLVQDAWRKGQRSEGQFLQGIKRYALSSDAAGRATLRCIAGSGQALGPAAGIGGAATAPIPVRSATPPGELAYCPVVVRPGVATTIYMPAWEEVATGKTGDDKSFTLSPLGANALVLSTKYEEVDTNIEIVGKSGLRYSLWAVSILTKSNDQLPDTSIEIIGEMPGDSSIVYGDRSSWMWQVASRRAPAAGADRTMPAGLVQASATPAALPPLGGGAAMRKMPPVETLKPKELRIDRLVFDDYEIELATPDSASIKPKRVFHDGKTVYLDFGRDGSWFYPVVRAVVDDISTPVTPTPIGDGNSIWAFDLEVLSDLILVDGTRRRVCLRYRPKPEQAAARSGGGKPS